MLSPKRKIPYNYTSADDNQIINHLFGSKVLKTVRTLELQTDTGRSSRLLHRFMGDLFIIERNPFLFREIVDHPRLKNYLFSQFKSDLNTIEQNAEHSDLSGVIAACRTRLSSLQADIDRFHHRKNRIIRLLSPIVGKKNIYFDAFNICAHATDATDWRLYMPAAILRPENESQVPALVKLIKPLGFHIIPRGGGTGLTGGATPLNSKCIMLNTEKLNTISGIEYCTDRHGRTFPAITLGAGVITQDAIDYVQKKDLIFATDPTSAWACTIGGNLSENAGGKKAVLFGTAIDNVLSYRIVLPDGCCYTVKRKAHPLRKIHPSDDIIFDIFDDTGTLCNTITLQADDLRKEGLGKDVTNKSLKGLPGIQKEGCDGIITSAQFVLYPCFEYKKTICIEFFGNDMSQAGQVIAMICDAFSDQHPALMALEHFDEEYIKAIDYKTKTSVGDRLIAVLLVDLVSNDKLNLQSGIQKLEGLLESFDKTGFSVAHTPEQSERFWQDRKRLGAIAAHTNAFKLNEDIVLPIHSLAQFAGWIDQTNIEEKKNNQNDIIIDIVEYLDAATPTADPDLLKKRVGQAKDLAYQTRKKLDIASRDALEAYIHAKNFFKEVIRSLRGYSIVIKNVTQIYETTRARLIVIATHMHAGDGNVHVNIPVLSNDREMMKRANDVADRVMEKAVVLGGVVSGEHGIGVTKVKHLDESILKEFADYKKKIDPSNLMNPGKFADPQIIEKVFTPSFNLLDIEARILSHSAMSDLSMKVAKCVRCGKCKVQCPVFYPSENMFFHPRNKNLALGALTEAMLYITQRTQSTGFKILKGVEQIADHCTVCHKCFIRCPVNIDSGDISISERNLLADKKFKQTSLPTEVTLSYLGTDNSFVNSLLRPSLIKGGAYVQRLCSQVVKPVANRPKLHKSKIIQLVKTKVTQPYPVTLRQFLPKTDKNQALVLEPEQKAQKTIFYFPGCGSERIFSSISMSSIFLLLKNRTRVVLPPPFLCCGYPFFVNAKQQDYERIMLENLIVFSRIRSMFQDLEFDAVVVSCGTCMEALSELGLDKSFDCSILDINEYVLELDTQLSLDSDFLYHAPCHDSLKGNALQLLDTRLNGHLIKTMPHCCSEAGTMALSRPMISDAMLKRKQTVFNTIASRQDRKTILTNCPSCIQGLGRLQDENLDVVHMAQALARIKGGKNWVKSFKTLALKSEVVTF